MVAGDGHIKKARFVEALVGGSDVGAAAQAVGRSGRTGRRWLSEPDVRRVLSDALSVRLRELNARVVHLAGDALGVLGEVVADGTAAPYVRVSAAAHLLDAALKLTEYCDLEGRLADLERRIADQEQGGR